MNIQSNWRLTFNPLGAAEILLDYGDMLESELNWSIKKPLQITMLDDAVAPYIRHGGNAVYNFSFRVMKPLEPDTQARKDIINSLKQVQAHVVGSLKVKTLSDGVHAGADWTFAHAYITEYSAIRDPDAEGIIQSYTLTATALA